MSVWGWFGGGGPSGLRALSGGDPLFLHVPEADTDRTADVYSRIGSAALGRISSVGLGVVEAVVGRVAGAMACAEVQGRAAAVLTPVALEHIGRQLMYDGESLHQIVSSRSGVRLVPSADWDVTGGPDAASWRYRVEVIGPSSTRTIRCSPARVLHVRRGESAERPWEGEAPLSRARLTHILAAQVERSMGHEAAAAFKQILPMPDSVSSSEVTLIRGRLSDPAETLVTPRTTQANFGGDAGGRPQRDWDPTRLGPEFTAAEQEVAEGVMARVATAMGVHPALVGGGGGGNGSVDREAVRQFRELLLQPLVARLESEAAEKLGGSIRIRWPISDHSMLLRIRTYQQALDAGLPAAEARWMARVEG